MDQDVTQYEKGRFRIFVIRKTWFGDDRKARIPSNRSYGASVMSGFWLRV